MEIVEQKDRMRLFQSPVRGDEIMEICGINPGPIVGKIKKAIEEAKKQLSFEAYVSLTEEFIAEKDGKPLHLKMELDRREYEELISSLLDKTIRCVDAALADAKLHAKDIDKIILVGGSSRTPLVTKGLISMDLTSTLRLTSLLRRISIICCS